LFFLGAMAAKNLSLRNAENETETSFDG